MSHREEAERLAGPHYPGCRISAVTLACTCHVGERARAIESALEQAEAEGWRKGVEAAASLAEEKAESFSHNYPEEARSIRIVAQAIRALLPPTEEKP